MDERRRFCRARVAHTDRQPAAPVLDHDPTPCDRTPVPDLSAPWSGELEDF